MDRNQSSSSIIAAKRLFILRHAKSSHDDPSLSDRERPLVFLFAGKAHPADEPGQELIRGLAHMARQEEFEGRILFIEGYDLHIARRLVSGVDVWLNNPVHPLEASGTSGMKAGMNGVLNLSILDGWWDEGYDGENGWGIKPASPEADPHRRDREGVREVDFALELATLKRGFFRAGDYVSKEER